jgi:hypothetical protein
VKDSGTRTEFSGGMVRETDTLKPAFNLILPKGVPYSEQMLTRFAEHMRRGALKYSDRNWENGVGLAEIERASGALFRHMMQYLNGEEDEDHASAIYFNVMQIEYIKYKLKEQNEATKLLNHSGSTDPAS